MLSSINFWKKSNAIKFKAITTQLIQKNPINSFEMAETQLIAKNPSESSSTFMMSPFTVPQGAQKHGDLEFKWLPLLETPCFGFSGPYACYSNTCKHNPTLENPAKHPTNARRKYPIANKPPFFTLFQQHVTYPPKRTTTDYEHEMGSMRPMDFAAAALDYQFIPYDPYEHNDEMR